MLQSQLGSGCQAFSNFTRCLYALPLRVDGSGVSIKVIYTVHWRVCDPRRKTRPVGYWRNVMVWDDVSGLCAPALPLTRPM